MKVKSILHTYIQRLTAFSLFLVLLSCLAFSQTYTLKGKVYDVEDKEPLSGATVVLSCSGEGAVCDNNGNYTIHLKYKECEIRFQFFGYDAFVKTVSFDSSNTITMNIPMQKIATFLDMVDVKAKRAGDIGKDESVISIDIIKPKHITDLNITTLDNAFGKTSGLVIVDSEPQMRGGSGFSSGMGSRVMVMLDEMPVMRADAGRPVWNLIPMENIEQIEVLKGASSVLYGSSATTGAINVRTTYPKGKPQTKVILYNGFYSRPQKDYRCSWDKGVVPLTYGANVSHTRKLGQKFDLVLSAEYAHDDGFVNMDTSHTAVLTNPTLYKTFMSDSASFHFDSDSYQKLVKEERMRLNFGTRYRPNDNISLGINGIILYSKNTMTHFWANADNGMYNVYPGSLSNMTDFICLLDPYYKYFGKDESSHSIKGRYMYSDNGATNNQDSRSKMYYLEYQYAKRFKWDMQLFAGAVAQFVASTGNVFSGVSILSSTDTIPKPKYSTNEAVYAQLEKKFFKKNHLTALIGGRFEYSQICEKFKQLTQDDSGGNYVDMKPVFRAGINYRIDSTYTSIRASFGQGYRFPTIGERYLTIKVGDYGFYPNPNLEAETSWNAEIGINQYYKIKEVIKGFIDIAAYYQRYNNYVEFFMGPWLPSEPTPAKQYGFKFFNTGKARIIGIDLSLGGEAKISKEVKGTYFFAYTYCRPQVLDTNKEFTSTASMTYTYVNTSTDASNQIMKYRLEHVLKADLGVTLFDCFSIGFSIQHYSLMKNVDVFFYSLDRYSSIASRPIRKSETAYPYDGLEAYMEDHNKGTTIYGLHASFELRNVTLAVIVNNLLNKEYSLRPMCPEAPRLTTLQLTYKFTEGEPFFPKKEKKSE